MRETPTTEGGGKIKVGKNQERPPGTGPLPMPTKADEKMQGREKTNHRKY